MLGAKMGLGLGLANVRSQNQSALGVADSFLLRRVVLFASLVFCEKRGLGKGL